MVTGRHPVGTSPLPSSSSILPWLFSPLSILLYAVYKPELCIRTMLNVAAEYNFPIDKIIFEFTEGEEVVNFQHLANSVNH